MSVIIDSKMPTAQQEQATQIIKEYFLDNLTVSFDNVNKVLVFKKDRRVVSVPVSLIENNQWSDIRFLFRATLDSANSLWNMSADKNDWSGKNHYNK